MPLSLAICNNEFLVYSFKRFAISSDFFPFGGDGFGSFIFGGKIIDPSLGSLSWSISACLCASSILFCVISANSCRVI